MATTYTEPVMVTARQPWIREIDPAVRLLWVLTDSLIRAKGRWFFMRSLYLRPTYAATVAVVDYSDPTARPRGVERNLAILGRRAQ